MNKYKSGLILIAIILLVIFFVVYIVFSGINTLSTVMNYPFQRTVQNISFTATDYNCINELAPSIDGFIFPTNFPMSNATKLEDIQINFSANYNDPNMILSLTYVNDIKNTMNINSDIILFNIPMGAPKTNINSDFIYEANLSMEKIPSGLPFSNENYFSYNIQSGNKSVFNRATGCNNGPIPLSCDQSAPNNCSLQINCVKFNLVNPQKPIKMFSLIGFIFIILMSFITYFYIFLTLRNNLTLLHDSIFEKSSIGSLIIKIVLICMILLFVAIYLWGLASGFSLILNKAHTKTAEDIATAWTLFHFCINIFGFYKLIY